MNAQTLLAFLTIVSHFINWLDALFMTDHPVIFSHTDLSL